MKTVKRFGLAAWFVIGMVLTAGRTLKGFALIVALALLGARGNPAHAEQYLIVARGPGFSPGFEAAVQAAGGVVVQKMDAIGVAVASSPDPSFVVSASSLAEVQAVVRDVAMPADFGTDADLSTNAAVASPWGEDPPDLTPFQWARDAIQARETLELGSTGLGVRVVVMDGSIMTKHPDLTDNLNTALSVSFVPEEGVEFVPGGLAGNFSHATHVAGIIAAANNGFGTTGVAPGAELVLAKVGRDADLTVRPSAAIAALVYAADIDADVVNMSWSVVLPKKQGLDVSSYPEWWQEWHSASIMTACVRAANYAHEHGVTLVAAAGNGGIKFPLNSWHRIPRDLPHVIAVSATGPIGWALDPTTDLDLPAWYSDTGKEVINLAAPGGLGDPPLFSEPCTVGGITLPCFAFDFVLSTSTRFGPEDPFEPSGTWTWARGTSMAAPHVAGIAALVIEANGGSLRPDQVGTILERSADDLGKSGNDDDYGAGRVNALRAVMQE